MLKQMAHFRVVLLFAISCCVATMMLQQRSAYGPWETRAALRPDKPLYENAAVPVQELHLNGFSLKRARESKTVRLSVGAQKYNLLYRTAAYKEANRGYEKTATRLDDKTAFPTCPVTKPNGTADPTEYGNRELRTTLWPKGTVEFRPGGPGEIYEDGSMAMKWGWLRAVSGKLSIEGRRLDKPAPPLRANVPDGYPDIGFQPTLLIFPTEGCWQITGKLNRSRLTFVTRVVKISEGN